MKRIVFAALLLSNLSAFAQPCKEVVGYYPNWQWYDRDKLVDPLSIDYSKYTVINYAFFSPQPDGSIDATDAWADENLLLGPMNWSTNENDSTKSLPYNAHLNNVKLLPSIGGWTLSNNFPIIAASSSLRSAFAHACMLLIDQYDFDGLDIDWEYPGFAEHGGTVDDKVNFTLLLQTLRDSLDAKSIATGETYLLTAALPAGQTNIANIEWNNVTPLLDIMNIMTYDFHGTWDNEANHHAPLYAPAQGDVTFNCDSAIQYLINHYNVPASKMTMGVAFYGHSLQTNGAPDLFAPINHQADAATFPEDLGTPLYYNVLLKMNLFNAHWDNQAKAPYLTGAGTLNTFVSYDDTASIGLKAQYILDNNLRGAIIWEITGDYIETTPGSGVVSATPLANKLGEVFCAQTPTAVDKQAPLSGITIYPNPAHDVLRIESTLAIESVVITDAVGKQILLPPSHLNSVDISGLTPGIYMVEITTKSNRYRQRFVKM